MTLPVARDVKTLATTVRRAIGRRRSRAAWQAHLAKRGALPTDTFRAVVYFADPTVNLYQIRQWYEPMRRLAETHPVVIITRDVGTASALVDECPLPVFHAETVSAIEDWLSSQPVGIAYYVNQNTRNFQMMRFHEPAHVFISHGESDKVYMASNQLKAYDYTFVAGDAAIERVTNRLFNFDVAAKLVPIGRPQVDVDYPGPTLPDDDRTVVLYAPTWEGDRPSMTYSSIATHAQSMLDALLATGTHRVIYRPHPRTGAFDPAYKQFHAGLVAKIEAANRTNPSALHMVDTETPFGWHLKAAHVCVCDISAVAFDFLATGKTLLLTEPVSPEAEVDRTGLVGKVRTLHAHEARDVLSVIAEIETGDDADGYPAIVKHYFGDVTPGASMDRFLRASDRIVSARNGRSDSL